MLYRQSQKVDFVFLLSQLTVHIIWQIFYLICDIENFLFYNFDHYTRCMASIIKQIVKLHFDNWKYIQI